MKKVPAPITTVSELQRQLDEIEIGSLNQSMNISLNSALPSLLNQSRQQSRAQSLIEDNRQPEDDTEQVYLKENNSFFYDYPTLRKRALKLLEKSKGYKHSQHNIVGGTKKSTLSSGASYLTTSSTLTSDGFLPSTWSKSSIGKPRFPMQNAWTVGIKLEQTGSSKLLSIYGELGGVGCPVCMGFGHSQSNCLTYLKLKLLQKRQPLYNKIFMSSYQILGNKIGQYNGGWLLSDLIGIACHVQREGTPIDAKNPLTANIHTLLTALVLEIIPVGDRRCQYCDGYGHVGVDTVTVKQGKNTKIKEGTILEIGKKTYITYKSSCPTKQGLEESILGFSEASRMYTEVIQEVRKETQLLFKKQQLRTGKNRDEKKTIQDTHDVAAYYRLALLDTIQDPKDKGDQEMVEGNNDRAGRQNARAIKFETEAFAKLDVIRAIPETGEQRAEQLDDIEVDGIIDVAVIAQTIEDNEATIFKSVQQSILGIWQLNNPLTNDQLTKAEQILNMDQFPLIIMSKDGILPQKSRILLLIMALAAYFPNFEGIAAENFTFKEVKAAQAFYKNYRSLPERVIQALCKNKEAYQTIRGWYKAAAGLADQDDEGVKIDSEFIKISHQPANQKYKRWDKYPQYAERLAQKIKEARQEFLKNKPADERGEEEGGDDQAQQPNSRLGFA